MPRSRLPAILSATIATLPDKPPFPSEKREAFFNMMRCAFDVAYGPVDDNSGPRIPMLDSQHPAWKAWKAADAKFDAPLTPNPEPPLYSIDHDGYVMSGTRQMKFVDIPAGAVIHDLRAVDNGNCSTIIWQDCGTRLDGSLPPGVTLR